MKITKERLKAFWTAHKTEFLGGGAFVAGMVVYAITRKKPPALHKAAKTLPAPPALQALGFAEYTDWGDCVEILDDISGAHPLESLGDVGVTLMDSVKGLSPESPVWVLVQARKIKD